MSRDDPFDEFFNEIERMMNEMLGGNAQFHFEHSTGDVSGSTHDVHLDVHESEEDLRVIADIPGVTREDIELKCDGKTLMMSASGEDRQYSEQISLPATVDEHSASASYNNGVLEVVFERDDETTSIDI